MGRQTACSVACEPSAQLTGTGQRDSTLKGFLFAVLERQDIDASAWALRAVAEQDCAAAWQNLREDVAHLALLPIQHCYWFGHAAPGRNPQQTALPGIQCCDDVAIVTPTCAEGEGCLAERDSRTALDRDLLKL